MNVAIVGSGALGCIYGVELARGGSQVTLVHRPGPPTPKRLHFDRLGSKKASGEFRLPGADRIPADANVILVAVRSENVDQRLLENLRQHSETPIVMLTPVMEPATSLIRSQLPRARLAMPSAMGSLIGKQLRFWVPKPAATLIEAPEGASPGSEPRELEELKSKLCEVGIPTRFDPTVAERNTATTVCFFPLQVMVSCVPEIDRWSRSPELTKLARAALVEGKRLADKLGPIDKGIALLAWLMRFRLSYQVLSRWAPRFAPHFVAFAEHHFGPKLHAQHQHLGSHILALADRHEVAQPALQKFLKIEQKLNRAAFREASGRRWNRASN